MVVTTSIPNAKDKLNKKQKRNLNNTERCEYNCGGYALDTFSWYHPYRQKDGDISDLLDKFQDDANAVLEYTTQYMLKEFKKKLRVITTLSELKENEEAVAYRIETEGYDFHFVRRKRNGSWYGKTGSCPTIYRYTEAEVFDFSSAAWGDGRYDSQMILFALITE